MNNPTHVYSTDDPTIVEVYRRTAAARAATSDQLAADLAALGAGPNIYGRAGYTGHPDEFTEIEQCGTTVPIGWRAVDGRLRPRPGKAGDPARKWLDEHRPADVRHALAAHGLPRQVWVPDPRRRGGSLVTQVEVFEHAGTVWAGYQGEPGGPDDFYSTPCTWRPRSLAEYHTAREAAGVDQKPALQPA